MIKSSWCKSFIQIKRDAGPGPGGSPALKRATEIDFRSGEAVYGVFRSKRAALDALRAIRDKRPFDAKDVKQVRVRGSELVIKHVGWPYQPTGLTSAQMNMPFCMATLLLEGDVFVDQFNDSVVNDLGSKGVGEIGIGTVDRSVCGSGPEPTRSVDGDRDDVRSRQRADQGVGR